MDLMRRILWHKSPRKHIRHRPQLPVEVLLDVFAFLDRSYLERVVAPSCRYLRDVVAALPARPHLIVRRLAIDEDLCVTVEWAGGASVSLTVGELARDWTPAVPSYVRIQHVEVTMISDSPAAFSFYADNQRIFDALTPALIACPNAKFTVCASTLFGRPATVCTTFERLLNTVATVPTIVIDERGFDDAPSAVGAARKHPGPLLELAAARQCQSLTILSAHVDMSLLGDHQLLIDWLHDPTIRTTGRSLRFELSEPWSEREMPPNYREYVRDVTAVLIERFTNATEPRSFALKLGNYSFKSTTPISTVERTFRNAQTREVLQIHEANSTEFQHLAVHAVRRRAPT